MILLLLFCQKYANVELGFIIKQQTRNNIIMTEQAIAERELTAFLEGIEKQQLETWKHQRTSQEMSEFVLRKLQALDDK